MAILLVTFAAGSALATPYELFARYALKEDGKTRKVEVPLGVGPTADDQIPDLLIGGAINATLEGVFFRVERTTEARALVTSMTSLHVKVSCAEERCQRALDQTQPDGFKIDLRAKDSATQEVLIINPDFLIEQVELLTIDLNWTLSKDFLCARELRFREDELKTRQDTLWRAVTSTVDAGVAAVSPGVGKFKYSFCAEAPQRVWTTRAATLQLDKQADGEDAARVHDRKELANELRKSIEKDWIDTWGQLQPISPTGDLLIQRKKSLNIIKNLGGAIGLLELEHTGDTRPLRVIASQDSNIRLMFKPQKDQSTVCERVKMTCEAFFDDYISLAMEVTDGDGKGEQELSTLKRERQEFEAEVRLQDYLEKRIVFRVYYENGGEKFLLGEEAVTIENLGLVTTLPVISEVLSLVAAAKGTPVNPKDQEFKSSVPLSVGYSFARSDARYLAITFPWTISFNLRAAPRLANFFKVFTHISGILPTAVATSTPTLESNPVPSTPQMSLAAGIGVGLGGVLTFSWGFSFVGPTEGDSFLLIGFDVAQIASLIR